MADTRTQLIESMFKPADGGYVFRAPAAFGIWPVRNYLVTESQKAQLATVAVPRHVIWWQIAFVVWILAVSMLASLAMFAYTGHKSPTIADLLAILAVLLLLMSAAFLARRWWVLWQLAPMLTVLPRTDMTITLGERRARAGAAMSIRQLAWCTVANVFAATAMLFNGFMQVATQQAESWLWLFSGAVFVGLSGYYMRMLIRRAAKAEAAASRS